MRNSLSDVPDPLRIASRPVASIAATIADGAAKFCERVSMHLVMLQGRTGAFYGDELIFEVGFYFLDSA